MPIPRNQHADQLFAAAFDAADRGQYVFPLVPGGKKPAIPSWHLRASTDHDEIAALWAAAQHAAQERGWVRGRRPRPFNVGVDCARSGLLVVDLDAAKGSGPPADWAGAHHGRDVITTLAAAAGQPWPVRTRIVSTPHHGEHHYFRPPSHPELRNRTGTPGWRIDIRGVGGYITAPGSISRHGRYRVIADEPIAPLPQWLVTALTPPPPPTRSQLYPPEKGPRPNAYIAAIIKRHSKTVAAAENGTRRDILNGAAYGLGMLVGRGELNYQQAHAALRDAAARHIGVADFTEHEAESTITHGLDDGARAAGHNPRRSAP